MKYFIGLLFSLFIFQGLHAQSSKSERNYVATIKGEEIAINLKQLNKQTPSKHPIIKFRVISSKKGNHHFLIQEIESPKGRVNRFMPLKENGGILYADEEKESSFVDCMLMECSTCEEVISHTGAAWCECSVGGCAQTDTSDPAEEIVQYLFQ